MSKDMSSTLNISSAVVVRTDWNYWAINKNNITDFSVFSPSKKEAVSFMIISYYRIKWQQKSQYYNYFVIFKRISDGIPRVTTSASRIFTFFKVLHQDLVFIEKQKLIIILIRRFFFLLKNYIVYNCVCTAFNANSESKMII